MNLDGLFSRYTQTYELEDGIINRLRRVCPPCTALSPSDRPECMHGGDLLFMYKKKYNRYTVAPLLRPLRFPLRHHEHLRVYPPGNYRFKRQIDIR